MKNFFARILKIESHVQRNQKQDSRLATAYFSPYYVTFDQFLHIFSKTRIVFAI